MEDRGQGTGNDTGKPVCLLRDTELKSSPQRGDARELAFPKISLGETAHCGDCFRCLTLAT